MRQRTARWVAGAAWDLVKLTTAVVVCMAIMAAAHGCLESAHAQPGPEVTVGGVALTVTLAESVEEQRRGLAGVPHLGDSHGCLFVFDPPEVARMWMQDCLIDLDVAFFDARGVMISPPLTMGTEPGPRQEWRVYYSPGPCSYALEVSAGWFARHGLGTDARLEVEWWALK